MFNSTEGAGNLQYFVENVFNYKLITDKLSAVASDLSYHVYVDHGAGNFQRCLKLL